MSYLAVFSQEKICVEYTELFTRENIESHIEDALSKFRAINGKRVYDAKSYYVGLCDSDYNLFREWRTQFKHDPDNITYYGITVFEIPITKNSVLVHARD